MSWLFGCLSQWFVKLTYKKVPSYTLHCYHRNRYHPIFPSHTNKPQGQVDMAGGYNQVTWTCTVFESQSGPIHLHNYISLNCDEVLLVLCLPSYQKFGEAYTEHCHAVSFRSQHNALACATIPCACMLCYRKCASSATAFYLFYLTN